MSTSEAFLVAMLSVFALPYLVWRLGRTDYYAPLVVVQIVAGILLGPGILGALLPGAYHAVFRPEVLQALTGIASWAVMMFVWSAGIELDLRQVWSHRRETGITASLALGTPLLCGAAVAAMLLMFPGWIGQKAMSWQFVLGIGMACAVTALPILVLFMEKLGMLHQPLGQRALRYASLDDVAIWGVLALILLDWHRFGRQLGFLVGFVLASLAVRRLMARIPEHDRWYVALIWLAATGFVADWSGLHFMVGAFLSGLVLDAAWFDRRRLASFRQIVLLTVMPVFFLSTGLKTSWQVGSGAVFAAAAALLLASVGGKLAGIRIAANVLGWNKGDASIIGWLLQTKALIMIIFANVMLDRGIISSQAFTALLLMAVASTMLTIPLVVPRLRQARQTAEAHAPVPA